MSIEKMTDFFAARVNGYDEHMLSEVEGCKEGYLKVAELVPDSAKTLLDLGCGTGLELDYIFEKSPDLCVMAIDLTEAMLDALQKKHNDKNIEIICGDYFKTDFGKSKFDAAVSVESLHHFDKEIKTKLYKRVCDSLCDNGVYIECDYMVESQAEEDLYFAENARIRHELGIGENEYYHYDTPCTVENQIKMLLAVGFKTAEQVFRQGGTTIIIARK